MPYCEENENVSNQFIKRFNEFTNNVYITKIFPEKSSHYLEQTITIPTHDMKVIATHVAYPTLAKQNETHRHVERARKRKEGF